MACYDGPTITIRRGDTNEGRFFVKDKLTGLPLDLTGWQKFWFTAKRSLEDSDGGAVIDLSSPSGGLVVSSPTTGQIDFKMAPAVTSGLGALELTFYYDVQGKTPAGEIKTILAGRLKYCPDVRQGTT